MKVFVKTMDDGRVIEAPKVYKNISNFNKSKRIMELHGFVEHVKGYSKTTGEVKYVLPEKWRYNKAYYTEMVYLGSEYEWNSTEGCWKMKLSVAKEYKLVEIRNATNDYMRELKKGFSDAEMETWARQENGVKLLSENVDSTEYDAQWVKALAQTRGISLEEQMQRISYASNLMNEYAYRLIGYQQSLEDKINAATTVEEVQNIKFEITGGVNHE